MTQAAHSGRAPVTVASGLVRVTVTSGTRRVDLVLPGAVPVAELLPELARSVGLLDPATVHGGYRVGTADGRRLVPDTGLTLQGVEDGGLLTVTAGVDDPPPRVYDDVVEAMADVVEHDLQPWQAASGRRTALLAAGLFLVLGAAALLVQRGSDLAAAATGVVALALCAGAIVLSRAQREPEAAVGVAWLGAGYAAVAGVMFAPDGGVPLGQPLALAGAGALVAGIVCVIGLGPGRTLVFPPVVVGALAAAAGLYLDSADGDGFAPAELLTTVLALIVLAGSVFPWLALGATSTRIDQLYTPADIVADPDDIERDRVAADARIAHEILLAISGTVGLLLVLIVPLAVSLGVTGTLLAVDACLIVMLRTRQYRTGSEVLTGLTAGIAGLATTAVAVLAVHDDWRPTLAVLLAVAGAVLLAATLTPSVPSVRRGRLGDVLESTALIALLPLLVVAVGLFTSVREAIG
ncbi:MULTISPECIES: type VII secretion integral membrane protein EccD [unclassified Nocardioides]|uniref:type VII secretion integral membrane protein EccD n=1 Tax=unclassified Nocardioides TaxID=2615069 RepID=UPI000702F0F8|nr:MULTISPECIES: type VII secretion integral membrane protein EccD [unclassified Nocardioides]KRC54078.1 type VII secretion integral membrane protein EccD [Nocardioides sp. Root79]KRC71414.1 type VII secretion integral membrane protein EccD [Nocardioides sp. Root240]